MNLQLLWHEKYSCNTMSIEWTFDSFNMRDKCLKSNVIWLFFISFNSFDIGYFIQSCNIAGSMQHALSTPLAYPGSCKDCFLCIPVFCRKFLNISNHWPDSWPEAHLHNWPIWPSQLFNLCQQLSWMTQLTLWGLLFQFHKQLALNFHTGHTCFFFQPFWHTNYIEITQFIMNKPVFLMTVQEAHKKYSSLMDQIRAKYE